MPEPDMDPNKAFQILGLEKTACLEEAKAGYRTRAKLCHPDRFGHDPGLRQAAESKMKALNDAFATVSKIVKSGKHPEEKAKASKTAVKPADRHEEKPKEMNPSPGITDWLKKIARSLSKKGGARPVKPNNIRKNVSGMKQGNNPFDTILNRMVSRDNRVDRSIKTGTVKKDGRPGKRRGLAPDYRSYMALKKKMGRKRRLMDADPGPIEKIRPVTRVPGIGDD